MTQPKNDVIPLFDQSEFTIQRLPKCAKSIFHSWFLEKIHGIVAFIQNMTVKDRDKKKNILYIHIIIILCYNNINMSNNLAFEIRLSNSD